MIRTMTYPSLSKQFSALDCLNGHPNKTPLFVSMVSHM